MGKRSLLVVEDNQESLELLVRDLKREFTGEFIILRAANGRHAMEILDICIVDCLVAAANMPEMDRLDLLEKIGSTRHKVKTIVIDKKGDTPVRECCNELGFTTYLSPPSLTNSLIKELRAS